MRSRGSIRPTDKPDVWRIVASVKDENGKRKRIWQTVIGNQTKAQDALAELLSGIKNGKVTAKGSEPAPEPQERPMLTREWLAMWLKSAQSDVRASTIRSYSQHVRDHLNPVIGDIALTDLRPVDIEMVKAQTLESGCSPATAHRVFATIRRALVIAERRELVTRNVARNVEPPKQKVRRQRIDLAVIERVLDLTDSEPLLGNYYRVAFATGMRRGEMHGTTWSNTDLDRGMIYVTQTLQREPGNGLVVGKPKSDTSSRQVHLDAGTIALLHEQHERQNIWRQDHLDVWTETGYIWTDELGVPVSPERLTKTFKRAAIAAGHPELHLHHLRHAHALALVEMKAHPRTVQQRLGHSSAAFTMAVYVSDSDALDEEAANLFGMRFGRRSVEKLPNDAIAEAAEKATEHA
ncbi:MAG: site-specific integrase [Chloroflexi bacterium]|nr:site-specific integrase [Chloroflexota bacterium]